MAQKDGKRRGHDCPRIPAQYGRKFTGPAIEAGETVDSGRRKWEAFRRDIARVLPLPRRTS